MFYLLHYTTTFTRTLPLQHCTTAFYGLPHLCDFSSILPRHGSTAVTFTLLRLVYAVYAVYAAGCRLRTPHILRLRRFYFAFALLPVAVPFLAVLHTTVCLFTWILHTGLQLRTFTVWLVRTRLHIYYLRLRTPAVYRLRVTTPPPHAHGLRTPLVATHTAHPHDMRLRLTRFFGLHTGYRLHIDSGLRYRTQFCGCALPVAGSAVHPAVLLPYCPPRTFTCYGCYLLDAPHYTLRSSHIACRSVLYTRFFTVAGSGSATLDCRSSLPCGYRLPRSPLFFLLLPCVRLDVAVCVALVCRTRSLLHLRCLRVVPPQYRVCRSCSLPFSPYRVLHSCYCVCYCRVGLILRLPLPHAFYTGYVLLPVTFVPLHTTPCRLPRLPFVTRSPAGCGCGLPLRRYHVCGFMRTLHVLVYRLLRYVVTLFTQLLFCTVVCTGCWFGYVC